MKKRMAIATTATGVLAAALVAIPTSQANAGPLICDPGTRTVKWVSTDHSRVLTHDVKGYEKEYSGGSRKITKTLSHTKTLSSGWTVSGGSSAGFSLGKVLASLDAHVDGSYTHTKGSTTTKSLSVTDTLTNKGQYWFYVGRYKASGYWVGYRCDRGTKWIEQAHGTAKTYAAIVDGAVRCGESVSSKSIAYIVKKQYC
ncbi:hypothetical protein [Streptomyces prunicolor]|uniref:hypothetical protein n=1 Tax=Streptomyces prunicolor TaxID=67348 RepID=UPI001319C323|nr:hypothetical protein [Streptomyces prunicolor]